MATASNVAGSAAGGAASIRDKAAALKSVADSGKSTQETHRKAIDAEQTSFDRFADVCIEQSKIASTPDEREKIREDMKSERAKMTESVNGHVSDSNSVFKVVGGLACVVFGLGVGALALYSSDKSKS